MSSLHSVLVHLIYACLVVFAVAWLAGAVWFGRKGGAGSSGWLRTVRRGMGVRVLLVLGVWLVSVLARLSPGFWGRLHYWQPALALLGALLAVASTGLLLWARWVLGTMWASIPTVQEHHELRTDGPYRLVRHPIYTGLLGLVTGGMLACGFGVWILFLVLAVPWLLNRVRVEDGLMARQFGAPYAAYRARVPALIPRIRSVSGSASRSGTSEATRRSGT